jgi:hypothetical protein
MAAFSHGACGPFVGGGHAVVKPLHADGELFEAQLPVVIAVEPLENVDRTGHPRSGAIGATGGRAKGWASAGVAARAASGIRFGAVAKPPRSVRPITSVRRATFRARTPGGEIGSVRTTFATRSLTAAITIPWWAIAMRHAFGAKWWSAPPRDSLAVARRPRASLVGVRTITRAPSIGRCGRLFGSIHLRPLRVGPLVIIRLHELRQDGHGHRREQAN